MQRWIAAGVVAMMLFLGGGYYAVRMMKENRPRPVWVPLPIPETMEIAERERLIKTLKTKLGDPQVLTRVSKDVGLATKWHLASDDEGGREIGKRLFVKSGEADTPTGKVPAIHIGVRGKAKESDVSGEISMRLMQDVWKILGIKPPPKKDM